MDIPRPSIAHAKKICRIIYIGMAVSIGGVTFGVSRPPQRQTSGTRFLMAKSFVWTATVSASSIT
jgi:hypothetical protein